MGMQGDAAHDKARKPQEATNLRIINKSTGHPKIIGLGFTKLRHQDASTTRDAMFSQLARHGVSKETAKLKLACIGVDGAAVNLGQFKGLKALMQKNPTDARTDPSLEYWGWYWVVLVHCINHLLELGIGDLKGADPYVLEFSENLQKIFKMYYYSSVMEADREELAFLTDGGLPASTELWQSLIKISKI